MYCQISAKRSENKGQSILEYGAPPVYFAMEYGTPAVYFALKTVCLFKVFGTPFTINENVNPGLLQWELSVLQTIVSSCLLNIIFVTHRSGICALQLVQIQLAEQIHKIKS